MACQVDIVDSHCRPSMLSKVNICCGFGGQSWRAMYATESLGEPSMLSKVNICGGFSMASMVDSHCGPSTLHVSIGESHGGPSMLSKVNICGGSSMVVVVVVAVLLFYVHGKHLSSCRDGQLT